MRDETFDGAIARLQDDGNGAYVVKPYLHLVCTEEKLEFAARCPRCFGWSEIDESTARELYDEGPVECQRCGEDLHLIANADCIREAVETVREVEGRLAAAFSLQGTENIAYLLGDSSTVSASSFTQADRLIRFDFELEQRQVGSKPAIFRLPNVRLPHHYVDRGCEGTRELAFGLAAREARRLNIRLKDAEGRQGAIGRRPEGC